MELSPVQRRIRDFYFKDGLGAGSDVTHVHRAALVPEQQLFSLAHLRRHLNDPLLDLDYLNLFQAGKPVDLSPARLYKLVQKRKIAFVDKLTAAGSRRHSTAARQRLSATRRRSFRSKATKPIAAMSTPTTCSSSTWRARSAGACIDGKRRGG